MTDNLPSRPAIKSMTCPCCGQRRVLSNSDAINLTGNFYNCLSCGARQVGTPLMPPDVLLPKLGLSFGALSCIILVVTAFLAFWIFSHDLKVARAMLVWALGDSAKLTRDLLAADPKLPYYRIFAYDAYQAVITLSLGVIPISALGLWLARKAKRLAILDPAKFGGLRIARVSLALCFCTFVLFTSAAVGSIPHMIENGRAKRAAATRAMMYELHAQALHRYYQEYGTYPQTLEDLARVKADTSPRSDYWEHDFTYSPVGVIASRGSAISLSDYKLVSAGPDGKLGTADDITMVNGVIVENQADADLTNSPETPLQ